MEHWTFERTTGHWWHEAAGWCVRPAAGGGWEVTRPGYSDTIAGGPWATAADAILAVEAHVAKQALGR